MRWSEFAEKECIDLVSGERLGNLLHADLRFQPQTGKIEAILIPVGGTWFKKQARQVELSWRVIKKVGPEMVIVDTDLQRT
jgi:YlmC/YmxH family sporulation protein